MVPFEGEISRKQNEWRTYELGPGFFRLVASFPAKANVSLYFDDFKRPTWHCCFIRAYLLNHTRAYSLGPWEDRITSINVLGGLRWIYIIEATFPIGEKNEHHPHLGDKTCI